MTCTVKLLWDNESGMWSTDADEILRLVLESDSFDATPTPAKKCNYQSKQAEKRLKKA